MADAPPRIPDFALLRPIGRGAYGEVWLARSVTGVYRAVKIVRRASFNEDRPFEREFAGIQRFEPVSVGQESQVGLLHVGRNEAEGFFYYVMELADDVETGEEIFPERYVPKTLKELRARQKRLPASECLDIGLALTRALAHLHGNGLVHRDIKPSNVIFVHGVAKLADIGLVSTIDTSHSFVGTEGFVPPEGPGTAAADIFSLGKVLYEISTGRDRNDYPNLPEDLDDLPDRRALLELNEVVLKACDSELRRRYATAEAMREDFLLLQAGRSVRRLHLMERRVRFIVEFGVAATIVAALAVGGFLWASAQTRRATRNLDRAERAEADALARLHEAKFNWARANRLTGRPGQRFDSLAELAKIAARTNVLDLRNEAIACLALPDLRPVKQWAKTPLWDSFNFSSDLRFYGTNDADGNVFIRDTVSDELRHTLPAQGAPVNASVTSRDGRFVATSDSSGRVWLWTLGTPTPRELLFEQNSRLIDFTPDSASLAVQIAEDKVQFVNVANGAVEQTFSRLASPRSLRISPDEEQLLFTDKSSVQIRRRSNGTLVRAIPLPEAASALAWHPDGSRFAAAWSKHIGVWEVATGRQRVLLVGHDALVVGLAFDDSGEWLASASWDRTTRLWQTDTAREVLNLNVSGNSLRLSPDGRSLAFKSWDNSRMHLYELADTRVARRFSVPYLHFTAKTVFSPDGQWLVAVDTIAPYLYHASTSVPVITMPVGNTAAAAFQPDGLALYTCGGRGLRRWLLRLSEDGAEFHIGPREVVTPTYLKAIHYFQFSGDGRWCVTSLQKGGPFFAFDREHPETVVQAGHEIRPGSLFDVNHDGTLAASWSERQPNRLQLWNPRTGLIVTNLDNSTPFQYAAVSPDNHWLAVSALDAVTLWTLDDWQPRHRIGRADAVPERYPLCFSSDNRVLAAVMSNREAWLIDVNTGATLAVLPVDRLITAIAFSPGGDALAVTCERGWFQHWDLRLLREQLAAMNLDWPASPLPAPFSTKKPARVTIDLQSSTPPESTAEIGAASDGALP